MESKEQLAAGAAGNGVAVLFALVTKGLDCPTAVEPGRPPAGARYTRDGLKKMFAMMGVKGRYAHKAAQLFFAKLERKANAETRFASGSRQLWQVHQHAEGRAYVSMPRSEFYDLCCSSLTEYKYKYAPSSDELKAACR